VQLTCKISLYPCGYGSKHNCPADQQPVQLPPQRSGTGTTWCLSDHTGERVLDMLKTVEVALRCAVEQAVTVVKTRTDDTYCNRDLTASSVSRGEDVAHGTDKKLQELTTLDTCRSMESLAQHQEA